jgi:hypothetical protein
MLISVDIPKEYKYIFLMYRFNDFTIIAENQNEFHNLIFQGESIKF